MTATVLIVDDEEHARLNIGNFLAAKGYDHIGVPTLGEARQVLSRGNADIILLDVQLPDGYGPILLEETAHLPMRPPIIVITAYGDIEMAVEAMKNGAIDFLQKPIRLEQLEKSIQRAWETVSMRRELAHLRSARQENMDFVVGESPKMKKLLDHANRIASAAVSVLLTGETGTGKEVLANYIHKVGSRKDRPFIAINCAAIQPTILESELFGHEAGAFTGADKRKHGLMETADGGVLFLDEISAMPVDMQVKLLRALAENSFRRVGGNKEMKVDVQIISASNRNLENMIKEGTFREDLYYRLKVAMLDLPPLRERKEDIPELVGMFVSRIAPSLGANIEDVTPRAMQALMNYYWPGNIRELKNVLHQAILFCDDPCIDLGHLPPEVSNSYRDSMD